MSEDIIDVTGTFCTLANIIFIPLKSYYYLGDGGLKKLIIKKGTGELVPQGNIRAIVHYTGRFQDGTVFDSSKKRGIPFQFSLGKRQVILGNYINSVRANTKVIHFILFYTYY